MIGPVVEDDFSDSFLGRGSTVLPLRGMSAIKNAASG